MITLKQCRIKNWDGTRISPLDQIRDRISTKMQYLEIVQNALEKKSINKRFHDEPQRTVNELIRWCHGAMGMYPSTSTGCFYFESDLKNLCYYQF